MGLVIFYRFFLCLLLCILLTVSCSRRPEEIRIGVIVTTGMELMLSSTLNAVEMARSDLERAHVPLISALSTHPGTTAGRKYVFRIAFLNSFQASGAALFSLRDLGAKRIAVLYNIANPYSQGIAETFRATVLKGKAHGDRCHLRGR